MTPKYTSKAIVPTVITAEMLVSTTAVDTTPEWNPDAAYSVGDRCMRSSEQRVFEREVAGASTAPPEDDKVNWLSFGATNPWAMFDNVVGSRTVANGNLTVVLRPGSVAGLALLELIGRQVTVTMRSRPGGPIVYTRTLSLDGTLIEDIYDWFFMPYEQRTDVVLTDLPWHYTNPEITVSITGSGTVACGVFKIGDLINIGVAQYDVGLEILDFTQKERDKWGRVSPSEDAPYAKRISLPVYVLRPDFNRVFRRLSAVRGIACIYISIEEEGMEPLIAYGYYKAFSIVVRYRNYLQASLSVESLI